MTIPTADIHECPEHGLFANPDYWPCPFCFPKEPIQKGPMAWSSTSCIWKGEERHLTLNYRPTADPEFQNYAFYFRRRHANPATEPAH